VRGGSLDADDARAFAVRAIEHGHARSASDGAHAAAAAKVARALEGRAEDGADTFGNVGALRFGALAV
jgi:hypothetical protein